ncbi:MAG: hypothetical protein M1436_02425, partial [Acidobacteria bacterium]|nr:hypothetical protein [Acidobacteriota bacterium]
MAPASPPFRISMPTTVGQVPVHHDYRPGGGRAMFWGDYVDGPTVERAAAPGDEGVAGERRFCAFRAAVHLSPGASQVGCDLRD